MGELRQPSPQQVSVKPAHVEERVPFANPLHAKYAATYVFQGILPFIERAANFLGCNLHQFGRAKGLWHVNQIQSLLGQVPSLPRQSQHECMQHAHETRMSLASALEGVDMAIHEVVSTLDLPVPHYLESRQVIPPTPPIDETIEVFEPGVVVTTRVDPVLQNIVEEPKRKAPKLKDS